MDIPRRTLETIKVHSIRYFPQLEKYADVQGKECSINRAHIACITDTTLYFLRWKGHSKDGAETIT